MDLPQELNQQIEREVFGAPPKRTATFYLHAQSDPAASEKAGYPVFRDIPYCTIRLAGEKDFVSRPATDEHRAEFPQAWAHFERVRSWEQHSLDLLPKMPPSVMASLKGLKVHTIEQLAERTDLPDVFQPWHAMAVRWKRFWSGDKPRLRLVNGEFVEAE